MPLPPSGVWAPRPFRGNPGPSKRTSLAHPLLVLPSTSELDRRRPPCRRIGVAPLLGFLPLRHLRNGAASHTGTTNFRLAGAWGFSPLRAFHSAPLPSDLVSCRWRPWGCALQSVSSRGSVRLSAPHALLSLPFLPDRISSLNPEPLERPRRLARRWAWPDRAKVRVALRRDGIAGGSVSAARPLRGRPFWAIALAG